MTTTDPRGTTDLAAARPSPPPELELDANLGAYGGTAATYSTALANGLRPLLAARTLTFRHVERMRRHYHLAPCLTVLSLPIVRADWTIVCDDDDIREYVTAAYERIATDLHRSAARALWAGYSPNVLVWDVDPDLGGLVVKKVRDLEPETMQALTDPTGAYAGMRQRQAGGTYGDPIDPVLTLWLVEGMESGNLTGRSVLEAALEPWQDQQAYRLFHARHLERFGEPVVKVRVPPGQTLTNGQEIAAAAAAGTTLPAPVYADNVDRGLAIGESLRHHSVVSFPSTQHLDAAGKPAGYEWDLSYLESSASSGADLREALDRTDRSMARAVFIPDLLFTSTDTGAYALGQEHRSIFDAATEGRLDDYARQITRHLISRLVAYNFGDRAPRARLEFGSVTDTDRDELWSLATELVKGGRLPVDTIELAARLGIPVGDVVEPPPAVEDPAPADAANARAAAAANGRARVVLRDVLPGYEQPQTGTGPWHRDLTARERVVPFSRLEQTLNAAESAAIDAVAALLETTRAKVLRQLAGVLAKGTRAEVLAAIATLSLGSPDKQAEVWTILSRTLWQEGLDAVRDELKPTPYADRVPTGLGPEARALAATYAITSATRHLAQLTTDVQLTALNAVTSGVTRAGVESLVSDLFDRELRSEGRPMRLTSRMLAAKALNEGRRDAIERGGVPLRGAQFSAILDRRTCPLCERQDELVIPVEHPDLSRFTPPVHHNCRCVWVWITRDEADFTPTWTTPPVSTVDANGSLVV